MARIEAWHGSLLDPSTKGLIDAQVRTQSLSFIGSRLMQHHNVFFVYGPMANLGGIAIWEGPIAYLMCVQYLKTDAHPLHVLYCWTFYGGSFAKLTQQNSSF